MDKGKAQALSARLIGTQLDGWTIEKYINHGKSAAVFTASKGTIPAAVKVFDTELIERYGDHAQLERINRELELRGQTHENLVSIYGGGFDAAQNLYFVIMEYLDGPNLSQALQTIGSDQIATLIRQLAAAARFLEERGIVHRDIKPENIALLEEGRRLVLLDLGVIRPIKGSNLTDPEGIQAFVGTLQYSSPEFLLREEVQDIDGWRALTFYQIGAVLHDLIMKRPIFERFATPYAKLVNAVQLEQPAIANPDVPSPLIDLARTCLLKNPKTRTRLLRWEDFDLLDKPRTSTARERVADKLVTLRAQTAEKKGTSDKHTIDVAHMRRNLIDTLRLAAVLARASIPSLPPMKQENSETDQSSLQFVFEPAPDSAFPHGLVIRVCTEIVDPPENVVSCSGCAYFPRSDGKLEPGTEVNQPWFEGVLENIALHEAFEQFFFQCTEWCLEVSPGLEKDSDLVFQIEPH